MERGKFIVFEGIDGCGKTTQLTLLSKALEKEGRRVFVTAEPTSMPTGRLLREALAGQVGRTPAEMAALFVTDRICHNVAPDGIRAKLEEGFDVICDRYYYSSLAYQGSQTDYGWVKHMNLDCPDILRPDLCVFLDLDPDVCLARIAAGRTSTEIYEKKELLEAFRTRFLSIFRELPDRVDIVNAAPSADEVAKLVLDAVHSIL